MGVATEITEMGSSFIFLTINVPSERERETKSVGDYSSKSPGAK
jgi:hypothetical protein